MQLFVVLFVCGVMVVVVHSADNDIRAAGATAVGDALRGLTALQTLDLECEYVVMLCGVGMMWCGCVMLW